MIESEIIIEDIAWQDVRARVHECAPQLATIIDKLSPTSKDKLQLAKYVYGTTIVDRGKGILSLPMGLVLKNSVEIFIQTNHHILPWLFLTEGNLFSFVNHFNTDPSYPPIHLFSVTAGARHLFSLPNIGDVNLFKNLQKDLGVNVDPPRDFIDHWRLFQTIVASPHVECDWQCELLVFPQCWLDRMNSDPAWSELRLFIMKDVYHGSLQQTKKIFIDYTLSCVQQHRNIKVNAFIIDAIKQLMSITTGSRPGFAPAVDNLAGPVDVLQRVLIEGYGLKRYAPIIFQPQHFSLDGDNRPVYYSLEYPSTLEQMQRTRRNANKLSELHEIKHVLGKYIDELLSQRMQLQGTLLHDIASQVKFDCFHNTKVTHPMVIPTADMAAEDPYLRTALAMHADRIFASSGAFVRGCVRISRLNDLNKVEI